MILFSECIETKGTLIVHTIFQYVCVDLSRKRVFILGPSHHVRLSGCALSGMERYQTPLYDLIIDQRSISIFAFCTFVFTVLCWELHNGYFNYSL